MKAALIVMAKNPVLGKVKTRLAKDVGEEKALAIYKELLQHTCDISSKANLDKFVFFSDEIPENDAFEGLFEKHLQKGGDLGQRMYNAFAKVFHQDYDQVIMIGTDCKEISTEHLHFASQSLQQVDICFGPAEDGGYYLIGMKQLQHSLFEQIPWSTSEVLNVSIARSEKQKQSYVLLPTLRDIDTLEDLNA